MALGALAQNAPVSIVPVGLTYFSAHKFRSRAAIEFGESIPVEPALVKEFNDGKKREAIGTLMIDISRALAAVTVSAPDFETLMVRSSRLQTIDIEILMYLRPSIARGDSISLIRLPISASRSCLCLSRRN